MEPILEIRHLRLIKEIAETGNLTRAAKKLFLTQPALSRQLLDLEERLGTNLFYRTRKRMILTEVGQELLETATQVLAEIEQAEASVARKVQGVRGEIKVGMHCVLCYRWLPGVIRRYRDHYPNVTLEVSNSRRFVKDLMTRKCDVAVTYFPADNGAIHQEPLFTDEVVAIMAPNHPLSTKPHLQDRDFDGTSLISLADQETDPFCNLFLRPGHVHPGRFMLVEQPEAVVELVKAGLGIAIMPRWSVLDKIVNHEIAASRVTQHGLKVVWHTARLVDLKPPAFLDEFIQLMQAQSRELPGVT